MSEKKSPFLPYSEQDTFSAHSSSSTSSTPFSAEMTLFPVTSPFVTSTTASPGPGINPPVSASRSKSGPASSTPGDAQPSFKCEHCGRGFLFKNNLKAHLRTHTRDRKYTCEICQKSFIYKESLKNHMLLHSNELPYLCDICGKKFRDRSNRRKHVKNVHKYLISSSGVPSGPLAPGEVSSGPSTPSVPKQKRKRTPKSETSTSSSGRRGSKTSTVTEEGGADPYEDVGPSKSHTSSSSASPSQHYFSHHHPEEYRTQLQSHPKREEGEVWPPMPIGSIAKKEPEPWQPNISLYPSHIATQYANPYPGGHSEIKGQGHPTSVPQESQYSAQYGLDQYHHPYSEPHHYWNTPQPPGQLDYGSSQPPPPAYHLMEQPSSSSSLEYSSHHLARQGPAPTGEQHHAQERLASMSIDNQNPANVPPTTTSNTNGSGGANPVLLYKDLSQFDFSYL